jgi:hypothetical protein
VYAEHPLPERGSWESCVRERWHARGPRGGIPRRTTRTSSATGSGIVMTVVALCRRQSATTEREAPMTDPARYVHVVDDVPELDALEQGPVLVHSLEGFLDAGNAAAIATRHLLA